MRTKAFVISLVSIALAFLQFGCGPSGPVETDAILDPGATPVATATVRTPNTPTPVRVSGTATPAPAQPTTAPTTAPTKSPTPVAQFAQWGLPGTGGFRTADRITSVSIPLTAGGQYVAFTFDQLYGGTSISSITYNGAALECGQAQGNAIDRFVTFACRIKGGGAFATGTIVVTGQIHELWPQASIPALPTSWSTTITVPSAPIVSSAAPAAVPTPVPAPVTVATFATWAGSFQTAPTTPVNTVSLALTSGGKYIAFTFDAQDLNNGFVAAQFGGTFLDCKRVANPAEQLPTIVCRRGDGSNFGTGAVTVNGSNLFKVWPQASAPLPAGWTTASVPNPIKLVGGAVPVKPVVTAPLPSHLVNLKAGMGVTRVANAKCTISHLEFVPDKSGGDVQYAQGRTAMYVRVVDAAGNIRKDLTIVVKWADGVDEKLESRDMFDTWLRDHSAHEKIQSTWLKEPGKYTRDIPMYAAAPAYSISIKGVTSDEAYGLGLDTANYHAANIVEFVCK